MENDPAFNFLGTSGVKVSNICLGTMTFGESNLGLPGQMNEEDSHKMMDRFAELGGNFIDTANVYGPKNSEMIVGTWLESKPRDNFVIATKVRGNMGDEINKNNIGLSRRHITQSIDESLKRLHTDYVDLYQTHCWDEGTCLEETLRTLDDLVRCGKVRYVGLSNVTGWQIQALVDTTQRMGLCPITSLQQQYSLLSRFSEVEPFQVCENQGITVLPWSPLKGGLLSGKFKRDSKPAEGRIGWVAGEESKRKSQAGPAWSQLDDKAFDIIEAADAIAKKIGRSTAQVAVRWLLQKDFVSSVIIGATKMQQLEDNMSAASGWKLTDEEMKQLDDVSNPELPYPYEMVFRLNNNRKNPYLPQQHVKNKM